MILTGICLNCLLLVAILIKLRNFYHVKSAWPVVSPSSHDNNSDVLVRAEAYERCLKGKEWLVLTTDTAIRYTIEYRARDKGHETRKERSSRTYSHYSGSFIHR